MNYARGISEARQRRGLSKRKLAALAGFDPSYLTRIESGAKVPSLATLEAIATALRVPLYLLALLSSEEQDLQGVSAADASELGAGLLNLLEDTDP